MRHLMTLVLLLSALFSDAEWVRGTLFLNSGVEKTGYIRNFRNETTTEIEFRKRQNDTIEKFSGNDISELQLRLKEGTLVAKYLYTADITIAGDYKISNQKVWLRVVYRGDFDVMSFYSGTFKDSDYYINWPGEDQAMMIYIREKKGKNTTENSLFLKKSIASIFYQRCDSMTDSAEKGTFTPYSIREVLKYYVENCKEITATVDK